MRGEGTRDGIPSRVKVPFLLLTLLGPHWATPPDQKHERCAPRLAIRDVER